MNRLSHGFRPVCLAASLLALAIGNWVVPSGGPGTVEAAVTLVSFTAAPQADRVVLTWRTATEVNTVGYNLHRSTSENGNYVKINSGLIPSSANPLTGGNYSYQDTGANNRASYYYRLEEIELNGSTQTVGTASTANGATTEPSATPTPTATALPPSPTPTSRPASTATPTATSTPRPSPTVTRTPTPSPQPTRTSTPTVFPSTTTPTATSSPVAVALSTATVRPQVGSSPTPPTQVPPKPTHTPTRASPIAAQSPPVAVADPRDAVSALSAGLGSQPAAARPTVAAPAPMREELTRSEQPTAVETLALTERLEQASDRPSKSLSALEMGIGGLFILGMLGVLASTIWGLTTYRRR